MRQCIVYVHGREAGILTETSAPRQYIFEYFDSYISDPAAEGISLTMPVSRNAYRSSTLFPYFANLLSEGENRTLQSTVLHIDKNDDFGILLATAQYDTAGAVTIQPI